MIVFATGNWQALDPAQCMELQFVYFTCACDAFELVHWTENWVIIKPGDIFLTVSSMLSFLSELNLKVILNGCI